MIAYLNGNFTHKTPTQVVVDVHGVGYEVHISLHTFSRIQHLDKGILFTHLVIREDAHLLYGFAEAEEKSLFVALIGVSGIGAATARMMLSSLPPSEIRRAIAQGNEQALERVKGIGKKTAQRLVLELRDKLQRRGPETILTGPDIPALEHNTGEADALNALLTLGIARPAAEAALRKVIQAGPSVGVEELIKRALQII